MMKDHDLEVGEAHAAASTRREAATSSGRIAGRVLNLQRSAGNREVASFLDEQRNPVTQVIGRGGGQPLEPAARSLMESRFGENFSDVRVHTGDQASVSAQALHANAYTAGNEIVFRDGHYRPGTADGDQTIAHELAHVVQQRSGPVDGTPIGGGVSLSDPGDRHEQAAERAAQSINAQRQAEASASEVEGPADSSTTSIEAGRVQRQLDETTEDEEELT